MKMKSKILILLIAVMPALTLPAQNEKPVLGTRIGNIAPEIIEKSNTGTTMKLSDTKGKMVLIDFGLPGAGLPAGKSDHHCGLPKIQRQEVHLRKRIHRIQRLS